MTEHDRANLSVIVFERKIPVSAGGAGEVGDFTLHPEQWNVSFEQGADALVEFSDAQVLGGHGVPTLDEKIDYDADA